MEPNQQNLPQVQVKISDEMLKGVYANMMQVMHTQEEFVLDFMDIFPPNGIVSSRIILSPSHLKRIVAALQDNLSKYEQAFGTVKQADAPSNQIGFKAE